MPINEKFLAARAAEQRFRDLAHLRAICWVPLRRRGQIYFRAPVLPLTLRHRLELRAASNAFFSPRPVLLGDVFLFLWRLHPHYRAPQFGRETFVARLDRKRCRLPRLWFALGSLRAARAHRRLTALVRRCDLGAAVAAVGEFLSLAAQDSPSDDGGASGSFSRANPDRNGADNLVNHLMSVYRLGHAEALDLPLAVANQLYRERILQQPEGDMDIFAPSDRLL